MAKFAVFDEFWTYLRVRHGKRREDLWVGLPDGIPFYESGDRDYKTFRFLLNWLPRSGINYTDHYCVYQVLDKRAVRSTLWRAIILGVGLARLARDTKVSRSQRMVDYSLALLNVIYLHVSMGISFILI
ncbi:hypothetical protein GFS33_11450 [Sulfolobus sp. E11-6]|nr:hypothetical protein GFS33_11450 [Sulfolobus sp. E11-6]